MLEQLRLEQTGDEQEHQREEENSPYHHGGVDSSTTGRHGRRGTSVAILETPVLGPPPSPPLLAPFEGESELEE